MELCICFMLFFVVFKKQKKSCTKLSLGSVGKSLGFFLCLVESMLHDRKSSILSPGRTWMLFLKDGIDTATELTQKDTWHLTT